MEKILKHIVGFPMFLVINVILAILIFIIFIFDKKLYNEMDFQKALNLKYMKRYYNDFIQ